MMYRRQREQVDARMFENNESDGGRVESRREAILISFFVVAVGCRGGVHLGRASCWIFRQEHSGRRHSFGRLFTVAKLAMP
jgi:hypothetical protein